MMRGLIFLGSQAGLESVPTYATSTPAPSLPFDEGSSLDERNRCLPPKKRKRCDLAAMWTPEQAGEEKEKSREEQGPSAMEAGTSAGIPAVGVLPTEVADEITVNDVVPENPGAVLPSFTLVSRGFVPSGFPSVRSLMVPCFFFLVGVPRVGSRCYGEGRAGRIRIGSGRSSGGDGGVGACGACGAHC